MGERNIKTENIDSKKPVTEEAAKVEKTAADEAVKMDKEPDKKAVDAAENSAEENIAADGAAASVAAESAAGATEENIPYNRRNVNRIKRAILITAALLIIIPTCLSIILFIKVNKLQKDLDECREELFKKETVTESEHRSEEEETSEEVMDNLDYQTSMYANARNDLLQSSEDSGFITSEYVGENSSEAMTVLDAEAEKEAEAGDAQDGDKTGVGDARAAGNNDAAEDGQSVDETSDDTDTSNADASDDQNDADEADNTEDDEEAVPLNGKKVYLTFDDGPSAYTDEILDILEEKGVKATFFVVGKEEEYYPAYQRIVEDGHSIGIHSYSHVYDSVYASLDSFKYDVESMHDLIYNVTGYDAWLYRFPGGSSNKTSGVDIQDCMKYLEDNGYVYFDWNAQNGDAVDYYVSPDQLNYNVMSFVRNNSGDSVVLMHDLGGHHNTMEALPDLIDTLKAEGYELLPITENTVPVRHVQYNDTEK